MGTGVVFHWGQCFKAAKKKPKRYFVSHWWCEKHNTFKHITVWTGIVTGSASLACISAQTWSIWSCWPRYTVSGSEGGRNLNSESQKLPSPSTLCRLSQTTFSSVRKPWSVTRRYSWPWETTHTDYTHLISVYKHAVSTMCICYYHKGGEGLSKVICQIWSMYILTLKVRIYQLCGARDYCLPFSIFII